MLESVEEMEQEENSDMNQHDLETFDDYLHNHVIDTGASFISSSCLKAAATFVATVEASQYHPRF